MLFPSALSAEFLKPHRSQFTIDSSKEFPSFVRIQPFDPILDGVFLPNRHAFQHFQGFLMVQEAIRTDAGWTGLGNGKGNVLKPSALLLKHKKKFS